MPAEWLVVPIRADGRRLGVARATSVKAVVRHLGVGAGTLEVAYDRATYGRLVEGAGVELRRNGRTLGTGWLTQVADIYPGGLRAAWVTDQAVLEGALIAPDPARAATAQNTVTHWRRTGVASAVMAALLAEQLGAAAHTDWRIPGLTVTAPAVPVGATVTAAARFTGLLDELRALSAGSGLDLGVHVTTDTAGALVAAVVPPVDSTGTAKFSTALRNLAGYEHIRSSPKVTAAILAGLPPDIPKTVDGAGKEIPLYTGQAAEDWQTLNTPHVRAVATDPITTAWTHARATTYRKGDTGATAKPLADQAADGVKEGQAGVTLTVQLRDTERLTYGRDYDLGHRVTVSVGRPGEPTVDVVDVIREIAFDYGRAGERITPAIGSASASALPTLPTRQALANIAARLRGLERS